METIMKSKTKALEVKKKSINLKMLGKNSPRHVITYCLSLLHENNICALMFYFQKYCDNVNIVEYSLQTGEPDVVKHLLFSTLFEL